jgi:membrane-associated protease RseP (regulator of RpoE activity)
MFWTRRTWIHVLLFVLTVASTWYYGGPSYSIPVVHILLGHEMGHYLMSRRYGMEATLPFFIPFPLPPFGTLGAIIRMRSAIPSRRALFDVGVAGPLTSLCLSIPAIVVGLSLSTAIPTAQVQEGMERLADPLLFSLLQRAVMGEVSADFDVIVHPIAYAGWVGLFVTALNLLPVGQLDGGHVVYALFGKRSRRVFVITLCVMAFITIFYNPGWFLLLVLISLFGFRHPPPLDDETPLGPKRKVLGAVVFAAFFLSFTPSPFPDLVKEFKPIFNWL